MSTADLTSPRDETPNYKRKRSRSRSEDINDAPPASRRRSRSPPAEPSKSNDANVSPKEHQLSARVAAMEIDKTAEEKAKEKEKRKELDAQAEFKKLLGTRSGGVYIPPARLRAMQAAAGQDKSSPEYQRITWDALRKSITGIVNRVNVANIKLIVPELFGENLIRGRGLFARSVMKAQSSSLPFTSVFAALVSIINTKLPQVGELVLTRLISQFRRSFKRNDKIVCHSTTTFIAHLVNQGVAHEIIALQILVLLLERPTDDSIEIAVGFMREVGAFLAENSPKANATVYERFRAVLNEGNISQRVQYMIEVLMQVRKDKYKDNPIIPEGLDLVEEDDQITHQIQLEETLEIQEGLNIFKFNPDYLEHEEKYKVVKAEILGEDSDEETDSAESESEDEDEVMQEKEGIEDRTETNLVNLRRIIYLTIMNALNYEEAVHKLLKVQIEEGQEIEMINMIIECCSQERSYSSFYGLVGERFSKLNRVWCDCFETAFKNYYETIHRYETNRLRNIARFFGHMFATDAISWVVFECVRINEDDTTSSSRIFMKILLQEMMESMGLKTLAERFKDPEVKHACQGMLPMDVPKNTRFAINYFTSIGLGIVTEEMREYLKNAPRIIMEQRRAMLEAESSDSDSDSESDTTSDDSDSSTSTSSSVSSRSRRRRRHSSTPPPPRRRIHDVSLSRSRSRTPPVVSSRRRRDSIERSPSPVPARTRDGRGRPRSISRSRSPPLRGPIGGKNHGRSISRSRSPIPPPRRYHNDSRSPPPPGRRVSRSPPLGGRRPPLPPLPRGGRDGSRSRSRSPPPQARQYRRDSRSRSRSPPPPPPPRDRNRNRDSERSGPSSGIPPSRRVGGERRRSPSYTRGGRDARDVKDIRDTRDARDIRGRDDSSSRASSRSRSPPLPPLRRRSPPPPSSSGQNRERSVSPDGLKGGRALPPHMRDGRGAPPHMRERERNDYGRRR